MSGEAAAGLIEDDLFVGATRPAMRWGVTYAALIGNALVSMEAFLLTHNLLAVLLALPLHGLAMLLCWRDARSFELLGLWARTHALQRIRTGAYWRASSYGGLAIELPDSRGRRPMPALGALR